MLLTLLAGREISKSPTHRSLPEGVALHLTIRPPEELSSEVSVTFDDLESALYWVSADGALENCAFISKVTGAIFYSSADGFADEEVPEDIDDATQYWAVPHKNDLDLGSALALRYVGEALPQDNREAHEYFHHRGAYSRFKALLQRRGHLDRWHEYENQATHQALLHWAAECGLRVVGSPRQRTGA